MRYFVVGILVVAILGIVFYLFWFGRFSGRDGAPVAGIQESPTPKFVDGGFNVQDLKIGDGDEAKAGNTVFVHYTGTLLSGIKFDSSLDRGEPLSFVLGVGQVIKGWEQGILGMKVGGRRKLVIPPALAYGERGVGTIPPNSTLVFEVELLNVK